MATSASPGKGYIPFARTMAEGHKVENTSVVAQGIDSDYYRIQHSAAETETSVATRSMIHGFTRPTAKSHPKAIVAPNEERRYKTKRSDGHGEGQGTSPQRPEVALPRMRSRLRRDRHPFRGFTPSLEKPLPHEAMHTEPARGAA